MRKNKLPLPPQVAPEVHPPTAEELAREAARAERLHTHHPRLATAETVITEITDTPPLLRQTPRARPPSTPCSSAASGQNGQNGQQTATLRLADLATPAAPGDGSVGLRPLWRLDSVASMQAYCREQAALARERKRAEAQREAAACEAFLATGGVCWGCRDTGYQVGALGHPCPDCDRGHAIAYEQQAARCDDLVRAAHLPVRYADYGFLTFPAHDIPAYRDVRAFADTWDGQQSLLLVGDYGRGKTGLLVSLVKHLIAQAVMDGRTLHAHFTTGVDMLDAVREGYSDGTSGQQMRALKTVGLLIVDDLGAEQPKPWVLERLFSVFNDRYNACLPTFVSTNYELPQLAARIGERVTERILQTFVGVEVVGPNLRRQTD